MPTLIRLLVVLLILGGLAYGGMVALVAVVSPREKDVTIRIPARELVANPDSGPIVRREINTTRTEPAAPAAPAPAAPEAAAPASAEPAPADDVVTVEQGVE